MSTRDYQAKPWSIRGNQYGAFGVGDILDVPRCRIRHSANQSLTSGVTTNLTFDTEDYVTDGMHSTTTNPGRIYARTQGVYLITLNLFFAVSANFNYRKAFIILNATTLIAVVQHEPVLGGVDATAIFVATPYALNAGDFVEAQAVQDSGGALNVLANASYSPVFSATLMSTT